MRRGIKIGMTIWSDWDDMALLVHAATHKQESRRRKRVEQLSHTDTAVHDPDMTVVAESTTGPTGLRAAAAESVPAAPWTPQYSPSGIDM